VSTHAARRLTIALLSAAVAIGFVLLVRALSGGAPAHPASGGIDPGANARVRGGSSANNDNPANPPRVTDAPRLLPVARPTGIPVRLAVASTPASPPTPADFLGLSFEMRSLPAIAADARSGDLVALLRSLGHGVLRFGGVSADEAAAWTGGGGPLPSWARVAITPGDLQGLAALARATGWRVLLTVNLGHYDPTVAAAQAAAAWAALGPYLAGIEIGNEPDRYVRKSLRAPGWDFAAYRAQAAAYAAAIARAAPGVALVGPDPSTGAVGLRWLAAAAHMLPLRLLSDHYYPLSSCGYAPTIAELLSASVRRQERERLAQMLTIAHAAHRAVRIDEANSISCEGRAGVSNTFAGALWALDYTARALTAGAAGLNFHDLPAKPGAYSALVNAGPAPAMTGSPSSPLPATTGTPSSPLSRSPPRPTDLRAAPEWYALLAARELPGSQPLHARAVGAAPGELSAYAFRARDGRLRIVLVDYAPPGAAPLAVQLQVPRATSAGASRYTSGSVLRLTASSPAAGSGVRLGGRAVARDGGWSPPGALPAVYDRAGTLSLQLDPSSAAVVTLYPR
jgi:hypothetical protein